MTEGMEKVVQLVDGKATDTLGDRRGQENRF